MSNITDVLNGLSSASLWQERVYKDLHAHPELSFHETRTAALAAAKLKELRLPYLGISILAGLAVFSSSPHPERATASARGGCLTEATRARH